MLVLAGVSINAVVGNNGILSKTQYASFLNEMAAVEEAVQLWKAGETIQSKGEDTKLIPANGLCNVNELTATERLAGEVGYYRLWSLKETQPTTDILSDANTFNGAFESELVFYPAGVQDLYYLNTDALEIKGNKTYLIDASTGMIYSMTGIGLKGVRCYSSNMAKAVMNGESTAPLFAEAEVSGTGSGDKLAGNVQDELLPDGRPNPDYDPYGFQIIANQSSDNIFKLYNNGELYGKGIKGSQLNTSVEKMEAINAYTWKEWSVPKEIGEYKKIIIGSFTSKTGNNTTGGGSMYFIDKNDDLWVYGDNPVGLSQEQSIEYTGRKPMKLDLGGLKASRVFAGMQSVFVITTDNRLLAAGSNPNGQLGVGHTNPVQTFEEVSVPNVENIETIYPDDPERNANVIKYNNNTFYYAGNGGRYNCGYSGNCLNFTQIFDGIHGPDFDQDIKDFSWTATCAILKKDGTLWVSGFYMMGDLSSESDSGFRKHKLTNIEKLYPLNTGTLAMLDANNKLYCFAINNSLGTENNSSAPKEMELPQSLINEGIKECFPSCTALYILSNSGNVYGTGYKYKLGMNSKEGFTEKIVKLDIDNVQTLYSDEVSSADVGMRSIALFYKDNKYYTTGNANLMFGDDILEKNWTLVANNVKQFNAKGNCYVDRDNNLWVAGDSRCCGLGERSTNYENIPNYIKCTDTNILGKVKKCEASPYVTYVLLENNELWATGLYSNSGILQYPGWEGEEDKTNFVKILDNVCFLAGYYNSTYPSKIAITSNGDAYGWGLPYGASNGLLACYQTPQKYNLPTEIGGVTNIKLLKCDTDWRSSLVTMSGELFMLGNWHGYNGGAEATQTFSKYTYNLDLEEGEKIISIEHTLSTCAIILTDRGRVYGYGMAKVMGINDTSDRLQETQLMRGLQGKNITQIASGNGWFIAVDSEGKVYGTGSNTYGILGRWKGAPRTAGRYRTAFEWVECPELEI